MDEGFPPGEHWLTEIDAGRTIELRAGDRLSVHLSGNPTAGYSWELAVVDRQVLAPLGDPAYRASSPAIGAGGFFAFEFRAAAGGRTDLRLVYRRPWEKRRRPAQSFAVTVVVEATAEAAHGLS
jgi:inhibitor of cysteine peptidase